jgi:hypothetical protein
MARGMANGEGITSQASTNEYRQAHDRVFGERKAGSRGRWVWDEDAGKLVRAEDYRPQSMAVNASILADRIHEGTTFDEGSRVVDIGSRRKRREFMARTGMVESSDVSKSWLEGKQREKDRKIDRSTDAAFESAARRLYNQGKLR